MTREEFNQTRFGCGMIIFHAPTNKAYHVVSVDFEEQLIGVDEREYFCQPIFEDEDIAIKWMRCEHCEIING